MWIPLPFPNRCGHCTGFRHFSVFGGLDPDENFLSSLCTDWKIVLSSFSISNDAESLEEFARKIDGMRLRRSTIDFMKVYFNMDLEIADEDETGGKVNMCRAVTMMRRSSFNSGMKKGLAQGEAIGLAKGETIGVAKEKLATVQRMKAKGYPIEDIMEATELTKEEIEKL